jgi:hypothetical protein
MSDTPTPETDADFPSLKRATNGTAVWVQIGRLRNLERQRDEAKADADALADALNDILSEVLTCACGECYACKHFDRWNRLTETYRLKYKEDSK